VHVLLTLVVLGILTVALIVLRLRWLRLSLRFRKAFLGVVVACAALSIFSTVTHWSTTSETANALLEWSRDLGYIFFVLLFTLLRPRWLTVTIAVVLIVPILSASIILPLGLVFNTVAPITKDIGGQVQSVKIPFSNPFNSGADIAVYYRPAYLPMLRRRIFSARFFKTQCDTARVYAEVESGPNPQHIFIRCPAAPSSPPDSAHVLIVPLH
jgi:hypothetical protein